MATAPLIYQAERTVFQGASIWVDPTPIEVPDLEEISDWVQGTWPVFSEEPPPPVRHKRSNSTAGTYFWARHDQETARGTWVRNREFPLGEIALGRKAPRWVLWHEFAHALADRLDGHRGHGRPFVRRYVEVVRHVELVDLQKAGAPLADALEREDRNVRR